MTQPATAPAATERKPRDDELDVFGLTHPGKVRKDNQDHFLICSLRGSVAVHHTSLPDPGNWPVGRLAFLAMVADGVGGSAMGEEASRLAIAGITEYVTQSMRGLGASIRRGCSTSDRSSYRVRRTRGT